MFLDLQVVFFFVCLIVEYFKQGYIHDLAMSSIIIYYCIIIISNNISNQVAHYMKFRIVKGWSTKLRVNCLILFKYYLYFFLSIQYVIHIAEHFNIM